MRRDPGSLSAARAPCTREDLEAHLRDVVFAASDDPDLVGVEVEMIPVDAATGAPLPVEPGGASEGIGPGRDGRARRLASGPFLRALGEHLGWSESVSPVGAPSLVLPGGGQLSFEPGGQLELSTPPYRSVDQLGARIEAVLGELGDAARAAGIALVSRGFVPGAAADPAELQFDAERYRRMCRHYDRSGPWGRRMMCRSAAVHVNVDLGPDPLRRWSVARRAAPGLVAAFANSPVAGGRSTGHRSWRAAQWRRLDPRRTGLPGSGDDPVVDYLEFALAAPAFLLGDGTVPAEPFGRWLERGVSLEEAEAHLTTLFPEVRPRGYLEVRCFDALPPRWCIVPAVVCAGLLYDPAALDRAWDRLPPVGEADLERAGRLGVRDAAVRRATLDVLELALEGARRLPPGMVGSGALGRAEEYRDRFTARGRDPGDEAEGRVTPPSAAPSGRPTSPR